MALWVLVGHNDSSPFLAHFDKTDNILQFLRIKKVETRVINHNQDLSYLLKDPESVLFIPSELLPEHTPALRFCNKHNIPIFAISSSDFISGYNCSSLGDNAKSSTSTIVSYLHQHNKTKMAYFGAATKNTDISKITEFYSQLKDFDENDVFFRFKSLDDCLEQFFQRRHEYDTIVCPNDMIAIYLIEKLKNLDPDYIEKTFIVSYMNSVLSQVYHTPITSVSYDTKYINPTIMKMYRNLVKSRNYLQTISMTLKPVLYPRMTTGNLPYIAGQSDDIAINHNSRNFPLPQKMSTDFYEPTILELLAIESLLCSSSETELKLMLLFLQGKNQEEAAQSLFIAIQTVRYRSSIIFKKLGVRNKKNFVSLFSHYVNIQNFENFIKNKKI